MKKSGREQQQQKEIFITVSVHKMKEKYTSQYEEKCVLLRFFMTIERC
jgi:hypothetical protein